MATDFSNIPLPDTPRGNQKKSGLSPTKYTRLHEKADLANLNDRLACYIDRVRSLESENKILSSELVSQQELVTREVSSVKAMYECELTEARKLLDELSREKAKLQIDSRRLFTDNEELNGNLQKKIEEVNQLELSLRKTENWLSDKSQACNLLKAEKKKLTDENKVLHEERSKLLEQLSETKKLLDEEILRRVDAENALQTAKEEHTFHEQLLENQLFETKRKVELELTEFDGKLNQEYEERLYHGLQEIREQYEIDLENNKEEIKKLYEEKIKSINNQLNRTSNVSSMAIQEVKTLQAKIDELNKKIRALEHERNVAQNNSSDLEKKLEHVRNEYMEEYRNQEVELNKLREGMAKQMQEYQDLMDIKVALDLEISAYRKLLEGEEARLNITPVASPGRPKGSRKVLKGRRRHAASFEETEVDSSNYSFTSSTKCDVTICEVSNEGKFIKLLNKSDNEVPMGYWQLFQKTSEKDIIYKFNRNFRLSPGSSVTIWSEDVADMPAKTPNMIVMKGKKWLVADEMKIVLVNDNEEEVASADNCKFKTSTKVFSRQYNSSFFGNQSQADLNTSVPSEERCCVM